LRDVNLRGADLSGADLNWQSHALISAILMRAAENINQEVLAAVIVAKQYELGYCWKYWLNDESDIYKVVGLDTKAWALSELAKWVKDGDGAPAAVRVAHELWKAQQQEANQSDIPSND
jgi:hypothetical protein